MKIDKARYEGYVWMSDSSEPSVVFPDNEWGMTFSDTDNPFVIEGNLWNATERVSVMIKYVDGKHIVRCTVVTDEDVKNVTRKEMIPHRIDGVDNILFLQFWTEVEDPLCENMVSLQPGKLVFVGFKRQEA